MKPLADPPREMDFYHYFHNRRVEVLAEFLGNQGFSRALDVGAADGMLLSIGLRNVIGIDIRRAHGVTVRGFS